MNNILFILSITVAIVSPYRHGRAASASFEDFPPYQRSGQHLAFQEQHQPFREQSFKSQEYLPYRPRPHRQESSSYLERPSFRDQALLRDYSQLKDQSFYSSQPGFKEPANFKEQPPPSYVQGPQFSNAEYSDQTPFRNDPPLSEQVPFNNDYQYQQREQPYHEEHRPYIGSTKSYDVETYKKTVKLNPEPQMKTQPLSFSGFANYLKYGNHGLGFASVPGASSYDNALPLTGETTPNASTPTVATATNKSPLENPVTATASTKIHVFGTLAPQLSAVKFAASAAMPTSNHNTLDIMPTPSAYAVTVTPNTSITPTGSFNSNHVPTSLTTAAGMTVLATDAPPMVTFQGNTFSPIRFDPSKLKESTSSDTFYIQSDLKSKLQPSILNYLLSQDAKSGLKNNMQGLSLDYLLSDVSGNSLSNSLGNSIGNGLSNSYTNTLTNSLNNGLTNSLSNSLSNSFSNSLNNGLSNSLNNGLGSNIPNTMFNYLLPEVSKNTLKSGMQNSWLNYLLGHGSKRGLPFQQSSIPETALNYMSLAALAERPKFTLPSIPIATLSAVSRPLQTINYIPTTLPRVSFLTQEPSASASLPLGLQVQLGGLGGMDYSLQSANLATRPMELGLSKVGLSLPELSRPHLSTFTKVGYGQQIW